MIACYANTKYNASIGDHCMFFHVFKVLLAVLQCPLQVHTPSLLLALQVSLLLPAHIMLKLTGTHL